MTNEHADLNDLYLSTLKHVSDNYRHAHSPRRQSEIEVIRFNARLNDPAKRYCLVDYRKQNVVFNYAEALWYLSGRNDLEFIRYDAPSMTNYSADALALPGTGYGAKLSKVLRAGETASERVITDDPSSKRAVLQIFDDEENIYKANIDVACKLALQLIQRDGQLHMVSYMRANDVYPGLLNDTLSFTFLQEYIAVLLDLQLGEYVHNVVSLHIYEKDIHRVDGVMEHSAAGVNHPEMYPSLPRNLPEAQVKIVLELERKIRNGNVRSGALEPHGLEGMWLDTVRLFWIHRQIKFEHALKRALVVELSEIHQKSLARLGSRILSVDGCDGETGAMVRWTLIRWLRLYGLLEFCSLLRPGHPVRLNLFLRTVSYVGA